MHFNKKRIVIQYYSITKARRFATVKYEIGGIFLLNFLLVQKNYRKNAFLPAKSLILNATDCIIYLLN